MQGIVFFMLAPPVLYIACFGLPTMFTMRLDAVGKKAAYGIFSVQLMNGTDTTTGRLGSCPHKGELTGHYIQETAPNGEPLVFTNSTCHYYFVAEGMLVIALLLSCYACFAQVKRLTSTKKVNMAAAIVGFIGWIVYYSGFQHDLVSMATSETTVANGPAQGLAIAAWAISICLAPFIGANPLLGPDSLPMPKLSRRPRTLEGHRHWASVLSTMLAVTAITLCVIAIALPNWLSQTTATISVLGNGKANYGIWQVCVEAGGVRKCANMLQKITGGLDSQSLCDIFTVDTPYCDYRVVAIAMLVITIIASAAAAVTIEPRIQAWCHGLAGVFGLIAMALWLRLQTVMNDTRKSGTSAIELDFCLGLVTFSWLANFASLGMSLIAGYSFALVAPAPAPGLHIRTF